MRWKFTSRAMTNGNDDPLTCSSSLFTPQSRENRLNVNTRRRMRQIWQLKRLGADAVVIP